MQVSINAYDNFVNSINSEQTRKLCPIHRAVLIPKRNDTTGEYETGMLRCPLCGSTYSEKQAFTTINLMEHSI